LPTENLRINVALEKSIYSLIERIARERGLSLSMVTRDLVSEVLEIHEDAALVRIADERVAASAGRKTLTHAEVWKWQCRTVCGITLTSKRRIFSNPIGPSRIEPICAVIRPRSARARYPRPKHEAWPDGYNPRVAA